MNHRAPVTGDALQSDVDTILDRIAIPREGDHVAILTKRGDPIVGIYCGTIPARHDASDWFRRTDRWIIDEGDDNVAHVPTPWILNAVVEHQTS